MMGDDAASASIGLSLTSVGGEKVLDCIGVREGVWRSSFDRLELVLRLRCLSSPRPGPSRYFSQRISTSARTFSSSVRISVDFIAM
jgi:hypothetical protein